MKISKITSVLIMVLIVASTAYASSMHCNNTCKRDFDKENNKLLTSLTCTLPNMPTFPITAPNVLNADGTLKKYFETKNTVCDVLGWMNGAVPFMQGHYGGINMQVTTPMELFLHKIAGKFQGGGTASTRITLDTDINVSSDEDIAFNDASDGNIHKHRA